MRSRWVVVSNSKFDPALDGFGFFNDPSLAEPATQAIELEPSREETAGYLNQSLTLKLIHEGPLSKLVEGILPNIAPPPPLPMLIQRILPGKIEGLCFGVSATAIDYYLKPNEKPRDVPTSSLMREECVERIRGAQEGFQAELLRIIKHFVALGAHQFMSQLGLDLQTLNLAELTVLCGAVKSGFSPLVITLFGSQKNVSPHAVVAFDAMELGDKTCRMSVYDPNRGARTQYIYVERSGKIGEQPQVKEIGYKVEGNLLKNFIVSK